MGLSGRVPPRVDAATKSGLLDLLEQAVGQGWTCAGLPGVEVSELRIYRWLHRRAVGELADQAPGGSPMHGLLDWEVADPGSGGAARRARPGPRALQRGAAARRHRVRDAKRRAPGPRSGDP